MFLLRLCLFVCVNLFLYAKCYIPEERLCVDSDCKGVISIARGNILYNPDRPGVLRFSKNQEIQIISKPKNGGDYWGAVIGGVKGFVPSQHIQEKRIIHKKEDLIPVIVDASHQVIKSSDKNTLETNTISQIPLGQDQTEQSVPSQASESVLGNLGNSNSFEKSINPSKAFEIVEGTTIYGDDTDDITPSATVDLKSPHSVAPTKLDKETAKQEERATIPPEVINLNSKYKADNLENNNFTIENVKKNDKESVVESKDIYAVEDEEEDEEGDDEDEEEDEGDETEDEMNESPDEHVKHSPIKGNKETNKIEKVEKMKTVDASNHVEQMIPSSSQTVLSGIVENLSETVVNVVTSQISSSVGNAEPKASAEQQPGVTFGSPPVDINKVEMSHERGAPNGWSILNNYKGNLPSDGGDLNVPLQQSAESLGVNYATPQTIISRLDNDPTPPPQVQMNAFASASAAGSNNAGGFEAVTPKMQQVTPEQSQVPSVSPSQIPDVVTPETITEKVTEASITTPQPVVSESSTIFSQFSVSADSVPEDTISNVNQSLTPEIIQEKLEITPEYLTATLQPDAAKTASSVTDIPQASNLVTPEMIQNVEEVTESSASSLVKDATEASMSPPPPPPPFPEMVAEGSLTSPPAPPPPPPPTLHAPDPSVIPPSLIEKVEEAVVTPYPEVVTEATVTEESFLGEAKVTEEAKTSETIREEFNTPPENPPPEEPGMFSQLTGMVSSWFTSAPEVLPGETKYDAHETFETMRNEKLRTESSKTPSEAPLGMCQNPELGPNCGDFASTDEQIISWNAWIPEGVTLDGIITQSNTIVYLIVTAITVLLFTLGHNFIEKRGKTGPLIAKINKLEQELLVTSKECLLLKDEIQSAREKITLYENSANDELVVSLQTELEESRKIRSDLESSIEVLQQELDAATEAGLDLNKMLSEVLTQKGGSESLLKSVENLQAQLDSQQKVIDEMTKKLGVKNKENEELQTALDAATEKSDNLEEQLTDIKHNLNLHLKEKEDLTRDLNSQISQLKTRINQLGETKEKEILKLKKDLEALQKKSTEISAELTVKEEEVKELKESMKNLKTKGNVKLETVFDVSRARAELAKEVKENQSLLEKLQKEENNQKSLAEQVKALDAEMERLKKGYEEAEQKKDEAEKKLEVLSTYFKEKETQLQKELGLQEALWAQKKGDEKAVYNMMKSLQEEVESYKSQNETLKKEILDQERGLKNQMASLEQKAHENWVAARQAERKLEESKQEMAQLRNRLTLIEKNNSNVDGKGNLRSSEELNGVEAASPILHDTSSPLLFPPLPLDPNSSSMLPPGFMPPPIFMPPPMGGFMPPPPFLPGDRRPPPLGRMSSPPLNNRFSPSSPADYPFERMSSPPLSPPGSSYRSPNEDREHYRHRTPPFPPPLHPRNWDDGNEIPGFIPISSQRDSRRDHKGSNVSSEHSSSESLDKSSRHCGRV